MTFAMGRAPAPGSDRIPVELFQILKDDAVESAALNMQYAICNMQYALNMQYAGSQHSNSQIGFGVQNEAGQSITEFCQESVPVIANTLYQQHKRRLYTWTSPYGQYQNQTDYILCSRRWRSYTVSKNKTGS